MTAMPDSNPPPPVPLPTPPLLPPRYALSLHAIVTIRERGLEHAWVELCLTHPDRTERDRVDPALIHALKRIDAAGGRVLRVVYNPGVQPVLIVTAFLDRSMKGKL